MNQISKTYSGLKKNPKQMRRGYNNHPFLKKNTINWGLISGKNNSHAEISNKQIRNDQEKKEKLLYSHNNKNSYNDSSN